MSGSSAVSRVQQALDSAHATQGSLNAFTYLDDERALLRAAAIDELIADGGSPGPLAGVPVGLKDLIDHEGRTTTAGSGFYRKQATESSVAVRALEESGAVIIGRTGLHEFAFGFSSENPHFGPVRNPWDTDTSPGGSSGGSGAAVGAGITPISIGTDTGGSIRVPAALCGCYGLKVTHGRISLDGVFPLALSVDTVGPLADSIENLSIAYRVMSDDLSREAEPSAVRLGIPQPWFDQAPMEARVASVFAATVEVLRELGHTVVPVEMPGVLPAPELMFAISSEINAVHAAFRERGLVYGEDVAARLDDCASVTTDQEEAGREWQREVREQFATALSDVDMLLTPTTPVTRKVIGEDSIGDRHYRAVLSWFSAVVNHALHPAISLPVIGSGDPPVSLQLIGSLGSETRLLGFGRSLENQGVVGFTPAPLGLGSA